MCGIAGVLTFQPANPEATRAAVGAMLATLRHRGPDGEGAWSTTTDAGHVVAFGHTRLSIIDLTDAGRQPMTRQRTTVTYNGEIYNYPALRSEFVSAGESFASRSDTEVLLAAYARWGSRAVEHLDGMFAFGLWDDAGQRLILARDRFGIKPLYVHQTSERVVFASEVRALLASGLVPRTLQRENLWHYLGYQTTPTPLTLVEGVRMLEPGAIAEIDATGGRRDRRYWDLLDVAANTAPAATLDEARRRVGELLHDAARSHVVSDVPVGVFLSAGVDSGAILSALAANGLRPQTFTVALEEEALDESALAADVARQFGAEHTEVRLRERDVLDLLPAVVGATDHPSGDAVNTFVVSKAVRDRGIKVALSGLGGDEIFGGYASFGRLSRLAASARRVGRSPRPIRAAAARVLRAAGGGRVAAEKAAAVVETAGTMAEMWPITRQVFSAAARHAMLRTDAVPPSAADSYEPMLTDAFNRHPEASVWAAISYAEARAYMHDVLLRDTDQMSMAHALEARVPLLDHRLAAYVLAQPDEWKRSATVAKPLLSQSLERPLPDAVTGKAKQGFVLPFEQWMRGALREYCAAQLGERGLDGRGLLQEGQGRRVWQRFLDRAPGVTWGRVWSLVALNAWLERQSL